MLTKPWTQSNTIKGILISLLPTIYLILRANGVDVTDGTLETIIDGVFALIGVVGAVWAIRGRINVNSRLE